MDLWEAIQERHSVLQYSSCNRESGLNIQLCIKEPSVFSDGLARYGKFENCGDCLDRPVPDWFQRGMEAAMPAPTAMNQQKYLLSLQGGSLSAKTFRGFYSRADLDIVKHHFEIGAGREQFEWARKEQGRN